MTEESLIVVTPHTEKTCSTCKHWGTGFNASNELSRIEDYDFWTGNEKLKNIQSKLDLYPSREKDRCQMKQNDVEKKQIHYIGVFFEQTTLHQRPTTKDLFCPLWEKFEEVTNQIKLTFSEWCSLRIPKDKEVYDVSLKGCELAGNRWSTDTRKKRVKELFQWTFKKYTEEEFNNIFKECEIAEKKSSWF